MRRNSNHIGKLIHQLLLLSFVVWAGWLSAQEEVAPLEQLVRVLPDASTAQQHLEYIDQQITQSISYSSSRFSDRTMIVDGDVVSVRDYLDQLFFFYEKAYLPTEDRILVVIKGRKNLQERRLFGYIRDRENGEVLAGALIEQVNGKEYAYTNNVGYYNIKLPEVSKQIAVSYLGYVDSVVQVSAAGDYQLDVSLTRGARIAPVVIEGAPIRDLEPREKRIDLEQLAAYPSLTGEQDILQGVKSDAAVQSGNEGQNGFYVRGGSPDQNLILLDGVAMYEVSHTAGIASIFNAKSIRDATLTTDGFDARYGGRMSSVLDIHLKDGHYRTVLGSVHAGVFGGGVHLEGPLVEGKTAFNLSAKTSWVNGFIDQLLPEETQYDDLDVDYSDLTLKLSHRFSPTSRLSFTMYSGSDDVQLISEERSERDGDFFTLQEDNALSWGSRLYALNFEQVLGDKWLLRAHGGALDYSYGSSSLYQFRQFVNNAGASRSLEVNSTSGIRDYSFSATGDYFASDHHKIVLGASVVRHSYRPVIKSTNTRDNTVTTTIQDSSRTYNTLEWAAHISDELRLGEVWQLKGGLRLTGFTTDEDSRYLYIEPRLEVTRELRNNQSISWSATRMTQNVHLLVNPGIGLPSDLWVPSTAAIAPEVSDQIAVSYRRQLRQGLTLKGTAYYKWQRNLLDYANPLDLFYTILNHSEVVPIEDQNRTWEDRVVTGDGLARGLELSAQRSFGAVTGWLSYALSRNDRRFESVNGGARFPFRFDRTHDINAGLRYQMNDRVDLAASFVYGTGNAITLALTEISDGQGGTILIPGDRNAFRLPAYHHLDLRVNYHTAIAGGGDLKASLAIYNVYNRYNPYYIYLYDDELAAEREFRQVSLFPFLPSLQISYDF